MCIRDSGKADYAVHLQEQWPGNKAFGMQTVRGAVLGKDNPYYGFPQMIRFAFNPNASSVKKIRRFIASPFVNDEVNALAEEALNKSSIGMDDITDLLVPKTFDLIESLLPSFPVGGITKAEQFESSL